MQDIDFNRNFATQMRYYLKKSGLSQLDVSIKMGVSTGTVSQWVNGGKIPRSYRIDQLCAIFHCNRSDLVDSKDPSLPKPSEIEEKYNMLKPWQKESIMDMINVYIMRNREFEEKNASVS